MTNVFLALALVVILKSLAIHRRQPFGAVDAFILSKTFSGRTGYGRTTQSTADETMSRDEYIVVDSCDAKASIQGSESGEAGDDDNNPSDNMPDPYIYVDASIKSVLTKRNPISTLKSLDLDLELIDKSSLQLQYNNIFSLLDKVANDGETRELDVLALLACQCGEAFFLPVEDPSEEFCKPSTLRTTLGDGSHATLPINLSNLLRMCTATDIDHESVWEVPSRVLVATLLSFNVLEAAIREITAQGKAGRAPLLKQMIERMEKLDSSGGEDSRPNLATLAALLRLLLLPSGLNLRNIIWHGFLPQIPRKWLALNVALIVALREEAQEQCSAPDNSSDALKATLTSISKLFEYHQSVLEHGRTVLTGSNPNCNLDVLLNSTSFIPRTHCQLFKFALHRFALQHPICFAAVSSLVLEHSLRLLWCEANERPEDKVAARGYDKYYVTLDGHGQRDKHDIILLPYLKPITGNDTSSQENQLIKRLGGSTISYLGDLFTSPHGPNLRSAVTHGIFDDQWFSELTRIAGNDPRGVEWLDQNLREVPMSLISSFHLISSSLGDSQSFPPVVLAHIKPAFSYSAIILREVDSIIRNLRRVEEMISSAELRWESIASAASSSTPYKRALSTLSFPGLTVDQLEILQRSVTPRYDYFYNKASVWTSSDMYKEHENNIYLAHCHAACTLIQELEIATSNYTESLSNAKSLLRDPSNSRQKKKAMRTLSIAPLTAQLYLVATYAALTHVETKLQQNEKNGPTGESDASLLKVVERARMCISTYSNLLDLNIDRSIKAADQFASSKVIRILRKNVE